MTGPANRQCGHPGCGSRPARPYLTGWRCAGHTPAALAGRAEPGAGRYCPPGVCWCGACPPRTVDLAAVLDHARAELVDEAAPAGLTPEAAALGYMRAGWPVFVLGKSKRPVANCRACKTAGPGHDPATCDHLTCHGFHAATTDPARLAAMLRKVPGGLLAIRTGTVAGLAVVDIDPRNGGQLDRDLMTPTATVATGGGGWHLYYRHPGHRLLPALPGRPGVDIKSDGGYVVAPPSVHPATRAPYRWVGGRGVAEMPPALRAALRPAQAPAAPDLAAVVTLAPARRAGGISSPPALLAAHLRSI